MDAKSLKYLLRSRSFKFAKNLKLSISTRKRIDNQLFIFNAGSKDVLSNLSKSEIRIL